MLIQNLWTDAPVLAQVFQEFGSISNLLLNLGKTVVIPLFPTPNLAQARSKLSAILLSWESVQFNYYAKYLGFLLGPEAGDKGWLEPKSKFLQRAVTWADQHLGLYCTALSYNVFALPVLTYLTQLSTPPKDVFEAEDQALRKIALGPTAWIPNSDLW